MELGIIFVQSEVFYKHGLKHVSKMLSKKLLMTNRGRFRWAHYIEYLPNNESDRDRN